MSEPRVSNVEVGDKANSAVFVIRIANPPLNILNKETRLRLLSDLERAISNKSVQCILIVGSDTAFSVGADITEMDVHIGKSENAKRAVMDAYVQAYRDHNLATVVYAIDSSPKPVVALITGQCFGGGLELALGCHYRFCTADAQMRFPEVLLGIIPGALGTQLLPRLAPFDVCVRMCIGSCDILSAKQALDAGIVDQIIPSEEERNMSGKERLESFLARTVRLLHNQIQRSTIVAKEGEIAPHPFKRTSLRPVVTSNLADSSRIAYMALTKLPSIEAGGRAAHGALRALQACIQHQHNFLAGCRVESDVSRELVVSDEAQALRWAFFAEKAATALSGTQSLGRHSATLSVGVVGSGFMGAGIAATAVLSGIPVVLCDVSAQALEKAKASIERIVLGAVRKKRINDTDAKSSLSHLKISTDLSALANTNFVIEAVFEDYSIKKDVFKNLDAICNEHCILCSNTSSLDVDVLAKVTRRPDQVMGLHFFSPAHVMKLVEIVKCTKTSEETVQAVVALVKKLRKTGVLVTNLPGFVGNRMIFVYFMEAMLLLEGGATVQQVDETMRMFGMAMGPFEMADLSGLDVGYRIRLSKGLVTSAVPEGTDSNSKRHETVASAQTPALSYSAIGDLLYQKGRLGAKNGLGFYKYAATVPGGRPKAQIDPIVTEIVSRESQRKAVLRAAQVTSPSSGIYALTPAISSALTISAAEIRERLLYALANEGFRLLGEHGCVSDRPGDVDVVYTHGYGFPAWRGGPLFWADSEVGLRELNLSLQKLHGRFPTAAWFEPAPLLVRMVHSNISLAQLQKTPSLVRQLMTQPERPASKL